jgi:D-3-phosphoglycerate dehydrogenase
MKVVVTDFLFDDLDLEAEALRGVAALVPNRVFRGNADALDRARDADGLLSQMATLDAGLIGGLERCKVIVRYGVGYDRIDLDAATRKGIAVCNVPDYGTQDVADHTLALMLALVRKLPAMIRQLREGGWGESPFRPIPRVSALTVGVYGFGRIGKAVAARIRAFGCSVIACDPYLDDETFARAGVERVSREELLTRSDLITLHTPLTQETRRLMDDAAFSRMKRGALLVNAARGGVVDTVALIRALDSGQVGGAALDVLDTEPIPADHPLWLRPNVFMTGHLAWYSEHSLRQLQRSVGEECARVLRGEPPKNPVNPDYIRFLST